MFHCLEFRELQKKSEFERAEWVRKQGNTLQLEFICIHLFHLNTSCNIFVTASFAGPHFIEYLGFAVTAECDVLLKCKVKKKKKETKQNHCQIFKDGSVANKLSPPPQIGNVRPDTEIIWSKDNIEIAEDDEEAKKIGKEDGELTFNIGKVRPLDRGCTSEGVVSS